jgi:hypothetical protein
MGGGGSGGRNKKSAALRRLAQRAWQEQNLTVTVVAAIHHKHTVYDQLLMGGRPILAVHEIPKWGFRILEKRKIWGCAGRGSLDLKKKAPHPLIDFALPPCRRFPPFSFLLSSWLL